MCVNDFLHFLISFLGYTKDLGYINELVLITIFSLDHMNILLHN